MFTQFSKMQNPFKAQIANPMSTPSFFSSANTPKTSFNDVVNKLMVNTDQTIKAPDELINRYLTAGDVDVHDIMIAYTKADIAVNVATQVATKIIQAYDRIQQIQV